MVMYKSLRRSRQFTNKVWSFRRHATNDNLTFTSVGTGGTLEFILNKVAGYAEFVAIFDAYRINKVVVKLRPVYTEVNINTSANTPAATAVPMFGIATDYDSVSTNPTSMAIIREYDNALVVPATKPITRSCVPRTAFPVYRDGVNWAYAQGNRRMWLDCKNTDVPHYGMVWFAEATINNTYRYEIEYIYYVSFKGLS